MYGCQIGWEAVNESALLTLLPLGSGLKLDPPRRTLHDGDLLDIGKNYTVLYVFYAQSVLSNAKDQHSLFSLKRYLIAAESSPRTQAIMVH